MTMPKKEKGRFIQAKVSSWFWADVQEHAKEFVDTGTGKKMYGSVSDLVRTAVENQMLRDKGGLHE